VPVHKAYLRLNSSPDSPYVDGPLLASILQPR